MRGEWDSTGKVHRLVAGLCGFPRGFGECVALGILDREDNLVGGLVFHNWFPEGGTIEISVGALTKNWCNRGILRQATEYAYDVCECQAIVARTSRDNSTRKIWKALGASEHVIPRLRGRDEAEYIYVLPEEVWRASRFAR